MGKGKAPKQKKQTQKQNKNKQKQTKKNTLSRKEKDIMRFLRPLLHVPLGLRKNTYYISCTINEIMCLKNTIGFTNEIQK